MPRSTVCVSRRAMFLKAAADRVKEIQFTAPVELTAGQPAAEGQPAKLPTFTIRAYTGGPMRVSMSYYPVIVDLSGLKTKQEIPILADHEAGVSHIIGQSSKVDVSAEGEPGIGIVGSVMSESPIAREVVGLAKNGFKWQASIGATIDRREFLDAGKSAVVNGTRVNGPLIIARESTLKEVSFVAIGADGNTSAAVAAKYGESTMNFNDWLKAKGFDPDKLSDDARTYLQAQYDLEQGGKSGSEPGNTTVTASDTTTSGASNPGGTIDLTAHNRALAENQRRVNAINALAAKYAGKIKAEDLNAWQAEAIEAGHKPDEFELKCLRASQTAPSVVGSTRRQQLSASVLSAALCVTAGMSESAVAATIPQSEREQVMNQVTAGAMRGYSLHALMDEVIYAANQHYSGSRKTESFIRAAFEADRSLRASGFSTISLPGILSNVANKAMIAAYDAQEVVWPKICATRPHGDFKPHTRYRLDSNGSFRKVGPDGELKHVGLSESSYTNQLDTYGAMIALNRQMIINDDLGAFLQITEILGRMSAIRLEEAVFVLLLSNAGNFFHANNKNLLSGQNSALSIDGLTAAEKAFLDQVDDNKKPIMITPKVLLVGTGLKTTADKLHAETAIVATGVTSSRNVEPARNPHAGKYPPVVSPYINNTAIRDQDGNEISGQSNTAWCLLANPNVRAAIGVATLNGKKTPTIESGETSFETLGIQWRAFHDFGVAFEDPRAAVWSAGA